MAKVAIVMTMQDFMKSGLTNCFVDFVFHVHTFLKRFGLHKMSRHPFALTWVLFHSKTVSLPLSRLSI